MKIRILPFRLRPRSRRQRSRILAASIAALVALSGARAQADVVATSTGGGGSGTFYFGQSFTTITSVPETNIHLNFYSNVPPTTPSGSGTGFILTTPYGGAPNALSPATPGFLGQGVASGGIYSFGTSVTLQPNTQYYFYENAQIFATGGQDYSGGGFYVSTGAGIPFSPQPFAALNFLVTGSPLAPVPSVAQSVPPTLFWDGRTNGLWTSPNWATTAADTQTTLIPGPTTDVTFSVTTGAMNQEATALGQNFTIHSLTVNDTTPVAINSGPGGTFTLTIAGNAGTGITVNPGANLTVTSNLTFAGASDTFAVNGTGTATVTGAFTAANGLIKTGSGALYLDGPVTGNVQTLQGLLGGTGTIMGSLYNAAIVSPGDAPGTLHVSGNYIQAPGGALVIKFAGFGLGQHDLLQVGGSANLAGTLVLLNVGGAQGLKVGQLVPFLTAAQGLTGRFSTVIDALANSNTLVTPALVYGPGVVSLAGAQGSFYQLARDLGLAPNEQSVARALDSVASRNRSNSLISYLDTQSLSAIPGDLEKLDPEQLTSMFTVAIALANVQSLNLQRRAEDIRSGSTGFSAAGFALNGANPGYSGALALDPAVAGPEGPDGKEMKAAPAPAQQRWGAFVSGTGDWVNVGNTNDANGYKLDSGGFTLGVDYKVCDHFTVGLSFGYTGTTSDLADGGRIFVNGGKVGIYSTAYSGAWYLDTAVNGGYNSYDTDREGLGGRARGSVDGGELNALVGTGIDFRMGGLTMGPTATFNYTDAALDGFTERGSLAPLNVHGSDEQSLRSAVGWKLSADCKVGGVLVKPELRVAWQHEFGDTAYSLDSSLANGGGDTFIVDGPKIGRDSVLLSAGFAIQCSERCSVFAYYDGELARTNYHASSVSGGLRFAF
jgi:uncharacterized protein with beta-barrel porin domain